MASTPLPSHDIALAAERAGVLDERSALVVGLGAGLVALPASAAPTGSPTIDNLLTFVAVAAVAWAGARAPWTLLVVSAGVAIGVAGASVPLLFGLAGMVAAVAAPIVARAVRSSVPPWLVTGFVHALAAGLVANSLVRAELGVFHGLSAIVGIGLAAVVGLVGIARRPRRARRWAAVAGIVVAIGAGIAVAATAAGLVAARADVAQGTKSARQAVEAVNQGRYVEAAELFSTASARFASADDRLGGGLVVPGRFLPGIAQNVRAVRELSAEAGVTLSAAGDALAGIDPSTLQPVDGAVDLDAVRAIATPLRDVRAAITGFRRQLDDVDSPWLVAPLQSELRTVRAEIDGDLPRLENAIGVVDLAPAMLGADGERRYLVLFTTPAEARGLGGFVGNYAELRAVDGRITVAEFGRRSRLDRRLTEAGGGRCGGCDPELIASYGRFGLDTGPGGGVADQVWANLTMPSHFPYVAEAAASLYPMSGGSEVDGVMIMDPYVVQALMTFTGPIEVPEFGRRIQPRQAARFIIEDQYLLAGDGNREERVDALDSLAQGVITRLLTGALPPPSRLANELSPMVAERRLLLWTASADERALFDRIGLLGNLPVPNPVGFSVAVTNQGSSKIDAFLQRSVDVRVESVEATRRLVAIVTLTNSAAVDGLPEYVVGNVVDLPIGTSRLLVTLYGPVAPLAVFRDGEAIATERLTEAGWTGQTDLVDIPAGGSVEYVVEYPLGPTVDLGTALAAAGVESADDPGDRRVVSVPPAWLQPLAVR